MADMEQVIRFTTTADGVSICYATVGQGPALVKAPNWLTHLEYEWQSPVWRHWWQELAKDHLVIRFDQRGCGLSDWSAEDFRSPLASATWRRWSTPLDWIVSRSWGYRKGEQSLSNTQCATLSESAISCWSEHTRGALSYEVRQKSSERKVRPCALLWSRDGVVMSRLTVSSSL